MKEHIWFNPRLLNMPINFTPEFEWHRAWLRLSGMNICLVDSSGISKDYGNHTRMKSLTHLLGINEDRDIANGKYWHDNFDLLMSQLSDRVFNAAQGRRELRLSYSGGTDSCLILAALMNNPKINEWINNDKFIIYTTPFAKKEDPDIWDRIIDAQLPVRFLDYDAISLDTTDNLMLTGEGNAYGTWFKIMMRDFAETDIFSTTYSTMKERMQDWFISRESSGLAWDFFNQLITVRGESSMSPYQAWALFENTCAEQCYMIRQCAYGVGPVRIDPHNGLMWFMQDKNFWDMCEYESRSRLYTTDDTLKYSALRYIAKWMNWDTVRPKRKISSQIIIPKIIRKSQIYSDNSYTKDVNLNEYADI